MEKLTILFKLSHKFTLKYLKSYFMIMLKPILIGSLGIVFLFTISLKPIFALLGLFVTLPCIFYSFWRGYFITYALNDVAYRFINKEENISIEDSINYLKPKEGDFAIYISICSILSILCFSPTFIYIFSKYQQNSINLNGDITSILSILGEFVLIGLINLIILMPFFNFVTQAYYFKKEEENLFNVILNCYKYLNPIGIMLIIIINLANTFLSQIAFIIYLPLIIILNLYTYSLNTFWFYSRIKSTNII